MAGVIKSVGRNAQGHRAPGPHDQLAGDTPADSKLAIARRTAQAEAGNGQAIEPGQAAEAAHPALQL
jgi:hypothetical protein